MGAAHPRRLRCWLNRYVRKHRDRLPEWIVEISGVDVLAHGRRVLLMEFTLNQRQLVELLRDQPPKETRSRGSNMWAVGRGRSASGRGILLANPHLRWAGADLFHEVHLTVPGKVNVMGATLIGMAGVGIGFNEHLGWSHTVNAHDSDDVYELTLGPEDSASYLYDGKLVPLSSEELSVKVKTPTGLVERKRRVFRSHYGPVITRRGLTAYALKSASLDGYRFVEEWNLLSKARDLAEFRRILDMQAIPLFNICYADREGNVFYVFNGRFPARPAGYDWSGVCRETHRPASGTTSSRRAAYRTS